MDFLKILDQLRGNRELLMIALAIAFAVYNWGYVASILPKLQSLGKWIGSAWTPAGFPPPVAGPVLTDAQLDFAAIERLQISANKRNCPECKAAVQAYLSHMFDDKTPPTVTFTTTARA